MAFRQSVQFFGRVATKPREFMTKNGAAVSFRLAHNYGWMDQQTQQWREEPTIWFGVNCFGTMAENVLRSLAVGDPVLVIGRMRDSQWTDDKGGVHPSWDITADAVAVDLRSGTTGRWVRSGQPGEAAAAAEGTGEGTGEGFGTGESVAFTDESIAAVIDGERVPAGGAESGEPPF